MTRPEYVLLAHTAEGRLHAMSCDTPERFGEKFTSTMQRQGCTVTRLTVAELDARDAARRAKTSPPQAAASARENAVAGRDLPPLGTELVHPVIGWATVSHLIGAAPHQQTVATGPQGSGLVMPGQWRRATDADRPKWMRCEVVPPAPAPVPAAPAPVPAVRMVSLFELVGA